MPHLRIDRRATSDRQIAKRETGKTGTQAGSQDPQATGANETQLEIGETRHMKLGITLPEMSTDEWRMLHQSQDLKSKMRDISGILYEMENDPDRFTLWDYLHTRNRYDLASEQLKELSERKL